MKKRRNIEAFSLSFLDCICCGFGAIVLLLVLSKLYDPSNYDLSNQSQELSQSLKEQLIAISNETEQTENELRTFDELIKKMNTINKIEANFIKTKKNSQVEKFYDKLGFSIKSETENKKEYIIDLKDYNFNKITYIKCI